MAQLILPANMGLESGILYLTAKPGNYFIAPHRTTPHHTTPKHIFQMTSCGMLFWRMELVPWYNDILYARN